MLASWTGSPIFVFHPLFGFHIVKDFNAFDADQRIARRLRQHSQAARDSGSARHATPSASNATHAG